MRKKILAILAMTFALVVPNVSAKAYTMPETIRVGLESKFKDKTSISVENKTISIGYERGGSFVSNGEISAAVGFSVAPSEQYFLKINQSFWGYVEAEAYASVLKTSGIAAVTNLDDIGWGVYVGGYAKESDAIQVASSFDGMATIIAPDKRKVALLDGGVPKIIFDNRTSFVQIKDASGSFLTLGERKYRGRIEFSRLGGNGITAISIVGMQEYLYSVVPSEMPASWHVEALKAQTVAARNYAVLNQNKHKASGYGVCDTTHCQVYLGAGNEHPNSTSAVDLTGNALVCYNGEPIEAVFFSSSGGATDDSENVWTAALPYFRSVKEVNEPTAKQWSRTFTLSEVTDLLTKNNANIGNATGVLIGNVSATGRVQELIIKGTNGSKSLTKENIRTFFSSSAGGSLESRMFTISGGGYNVSPTLVYAQGNGVPQQIQLKDALAASASAVSQKIAQTEVYVIGKDGVKSYPIENKTVASQGDGSTIVFTGSGWGHGVGLSQHGAKGMAELGYSYEEILKWYYTGTEVIK